MKASRFVLAPALALALSGAALAQQKAWGQDRGRSTAQAQQQRRPESDHATQPAAQWQQAREDNDRDRNRTEPTGQWQQPARQDQGRDDDRARTTAQWQQPRRDGDDRGDRDRVYRTRPAYPTGAYYPNRYPSGVYSAYGNQGLSQAQQIGYQDGLNDGSNDRATGHSFRPTADSNYRHADRGWNSGIVDRNSYSNAYRQAYMQGYERGYGSTGWGY